MSAQDAIGTSGRATDIACAVKRRNVPHTPAPSSITSGAGGLSVWKCPHQPSGPGEEGTEQLAGGPGPCGPQRIGPLNARSSPKRARGWRQKSPAKTPLLRGRIGVLVIGLTTTDVISRGIKLSVKGCLQLTLLIRRGLFLWGLGQLDEHWTALDNQLLQVFLEVS